MSGNAVIAAAGSGKTERVIAAALAVPEHERVLITTYTENNAKEIRARVATRLGRIPSNIEVVPWFTFLIRQGVKPYQTHVLGINEASGLYFESRPGYPKKADARQYYANPAGNIYRDYLAEFVLLLNEKSNGAVVSRLEAIYSHIFIDEIQDISGRDFEVLEALIGSSLSVTMVGDPRQGTYSTTQSRTNKKLTKAGVVDWLRKLEAESKLSITVDAFSMRCVQAICDIGDSLYPELVATESRNIEITGHDGVFLIRSEHVAAYVEAHAPQLLRWNSRSKDYGYLARNMGDVKGLTFGRVLISPTSTMEAHLKKGASLEPDTRAKFYVGLTRARHSVAVVLDTPGSSTLPYWAPPSSEA